MGPDPAPLNDPAGRDRRQPVADLAAGRWSRWPGLAPPVTLDDAAAQLGPSIDPQPHSGMFVGPTLFQRWSATPGAPRGLTVWFEGVVVVGVDVRGAQRDPADPGLPEPEAVLDSGYGDQYRQCVWGERGLVIHRLADDDTTAELLLGLAPFDSAQWETHPLRWWGGRGRHR